MRARTFVASVAFLLASCGASPMPTAWLGEPVDPEASHSALRYFDTDLVSLNGACPVQGLPLNPVIEPLYVNGRPIGFC
jgi:hypothetical protein